MSDQGEQIIQVSFDEDDDTTSRRDGIYSVAGIPYFNSFLFVKGKASSCMISFHLLHIPFRVTAEKFKIKTDEFGKSCCLYL